MRKIRLILHSVPLLKVPSSEVRHLNCDTLEQMLTRLDLEQYLDTLQAENLDLESLVINTQWTCKLKCNSSLKLVSLFF